ncbi:MAG: hypothetical protein Q9227_000725 [Pyrenula ochraceoflavens]
MPDNKSKPFDTADNTHKADTGQFNNGSVGNSGNRTKKQSHVIMKEPHSRGWTLATDFPVMGPHIENSDCKCKSCSGQYHELSSDAGQLALTLSSLEELVKKGRLDDSQQSQLLQNGQACKHVLLDIQTMLGKYESLSSKSKRIHDMLGWDYEGARELRNRLTANVVMLSAFYDSLTMSTVYRLEDAMNRLLREIERGQKSADSISVLTTDASQAITEPQAWQQVIKDLEDLGISDVDANNHRAFIVEWFKKALDEAGGSIAQAAANASSRPSESVQSNQTLTRPYFGVPLDELSSRDGIAVPLLVHKCVQAIDFFGLDVEGIYNVTGSIRRVRKMRAKFDEDLSGVNFLVPVTFDHDVHSLATLLKEFLRALPTALIPDDASQELRAAIRIDDDYWRQTRLKEVIDALPEAHFATLRRLILHLNRVAQHCDFNRMTAHNLAVCFAPTVFKGALADEIALVTHHIRIMETIINNTHLIFHNYAEEAKYVSLHSSPSNGW